MTGCLNWRNIMVGAVMAGLIGPAMALDGVTFNVEGASPVVRAALEDASQLAQFRRGSDQPAQDILAIARAEYATLTGELYAQGHYGGTVSILVDGSEAANIALMDTPKTISNITLRVTTGPAFVFGRAAIAPLVGKAPLAQEFTIGAPAKSDVIVDATLAAIEDWRNAGYAKTVVAQSQLLADHKTQKVSADISLDHGPRLRFGELIIEGAQNMRPARIDAIAGLPKGEEFSARELARVTQRLLRTGVFSSVTLEEGAADTQNGTLPITAILAEERVRRFALSADLATLEGLSLGVSGTHRNLFGGAEKLALAASATRIGVDSGGLDYTLSATFERPATFSPDTTFAAGVVFDRERDVGTTLDSISFSSTLTHYFSNTLTGTGGVAYQLSRAIDPAGTTIFRSLNFPFGLSWDTRNIKKSASDGVYITANVKPYVGFGSTQSGVRSEFDARGYLGVTPSDSLVLAARIQIGMISGTSLAGAPREDLFTSGGPGTVRGQPYRSLGVKKLTGSGGALFETGGTHFLGGSIEARQKVNDTIGLVGFLDVGRIDAGGFFGTVNNWHAGAGVGLRYMTAIGPVRLDVAGPLSGATGDGPQIYVGIGQAF
jgi:translocation and assembly module TamA